MDFGDILNEWESRRTPERSGRDMERYLSEYLPDKDIAAMKDGPEKDESSASNRALLRQLKPQAELDLHGLNSSDAIARLGLFLRECRKKGLRKVLIIHGKGNHSSGEPVLGKEVRKYLERCAFAGEFRTASREMGGKGAVWVILRV
jgi:DNA-nicking Smr family endonuclease